MPPRTRRRAALCTALSLSLGAAAASAALVELPPGALINDDAAAGISPSRNAGKIDITGARASDTAAMTPWAAFEQTTAGAQQIFVREFTGDRWVTRGGSLNIDTAVDAEHPAIDVAGARLNVPWAAWYEPSSALPGGATNIFASRFAAAQNQWLAAGQDRTASNRVPSLNINTDRVAENPSIAGGAIATTEPPEPWVTWQEQDGAAAVANQRFQIFVSRGQNRGAAATCAGFSPGSGTTLNNFCWQMVGTPRVSRNALTSGGATDPSLNIDVTRDGIEPDIAFTGPGDTVPWVVWYETGASGAGLAANDMVFAAKGVKDDTVAGGVRWVAVGNTGTGELNAASPCAASIAAERGCALNADPTRKAEDARVASGTMAPGGTTTPWVIWSEEVEPGRQGIFVSHLVNERFVVINGGRPISAAGVNAIDPDITFAGNTPVLTWRQEGGNVVTGHLEGTGANPVFVQDQVIAANTGVLEDQRAPVGSTCQARAASDLKPCAASIVGTPFVAFLDRTSGTQKLLARAWSTGDPTTLAASDVKEATAGSNGTATFSGQVDTAGIEARVFFEFGLTTAYGSRTAESVLPAASGARNFSATSSSLPEGVVHYRAVVATAFGTRVGADRTVTITRARAATPVPVSTPTPTPPLAPNVAPVLTLARTLPGRVVRRGAVARVNVPVRVNEASTVVVQVRVGRRVVRQVTRVRAGAGTFVVPVSVGRLRRTTVFTVRVVARDAQGASTVRTGTLRVRVRA